MVIPNSGPLTFVIIRDEFAGSNPIIFTQYYRGGGIVPDTPENINIPTSGEIAVGDFYGAEGATIVIIETNKQDVNLAASEYFGSDWAADRAKVLIVNPGVTLGASSASAIALSAPSGMGATLEIRNNGSILGHGGAGGPGGNPNGNSGTPGSPGGTAMSISVPVSIDNQGTIAGGGGGGGGGGAGSGGSVRNPRTCRRFASGQGCDTCPCPGGYQIQSCNNTGIRCAGGRKRIRTTTCFQDYDCSTTSGTNGGPGRPGGIGAGSNGPAGGGGSPSGGGGGGAGSGGAGGVGGALGAAGNPGVNGSPGGSGGGAGNAGNYVSGNSFVTWINDGTRLGGAV